MSNKKIQDFVKEFAPRKKEKLKEELPLNEEMEHLWEMATIGKSCGAFRMVVRSNESVTKTEPAHVSIQETNSWQFIGKVFLNTPKPPKNEDEIVTDPIDLGKPFDRRECLKWANSQYRNTNITNWEQAINAYNDQRETFHPGQI